MIKKITDAIEGSLRVRWYLLTFCVYEKRVKVEAVMRFPVLAEGL